MIQISKRGMDMPSSPIRKLASHAEAAKKEGVKVYHLNIGQHPYKAHESVLYWLMN